MLTSKSVVNVYCYLLPTSLFIAGAPPGVAVSPQGTVPEADDSIRRDHRKLMDFMAVLLSFETVDRRNPVHPEYRIYKYIENMALDRNI